MIKVIVRFGGFQQAAQRINTDDDFAVARVFFGLEFDDSKHYKLYVDVKQTSGDKFTAEALEVSRIRNADGIITKVEIFPMSHLET